MALAEMLVNGRGSMPRSRSGRRPGGRWFDAAAELGHGQAQLMLGRYLAEGAVGEPNPAEARLWLEQAAAQGIEEARADLAALPAPTLQ